MNKSNPNWESLSPKVKALPNSPGVYKYYSKDEEIIYVGKAKDLKKRVSSYFSKSKHENRKTEILVSRIFDIRFILVETEFDALLLESNLIKKYQPRFNVLLKDDKSYPWICIKNERFPRVFSTRRIIRDGSLYFGPYPSARMMNTLLELIRNLFQIRTCNFALSEENVSKGKFRVCLDYHIGNCAGPCEGHQTEGDYNTDIAEIKSMIKGNIGSVKDLLHGKMMELSANLDFEKAQSTKEKIDALEKYQAKSTIVHPSITNVDVFSLINDISTGFVNFMRLVNGGIVQMYTVEIKKRLDESDEELLGQSIAEIKRRYDFLSPELLVSHPISIDGLKISMPKIGDKRKLIDLGLRNAKYYQLDKRKQEAIKDPEKATLRILETAQKDLNLAELPKHIECFDNSNIQGTNPASACVVFKDAKPSKADYRHFNIKTVDGPDDYASMEEVIYRRYKRLLDEGESLPQLIIIDGGKGQLSSAVKSLQDLNLMGEIAIIGIAKRLEEIFYPGDSYPLYLDKRSETLKLIQSLRNEAHRFSLRHHRNLRSKSALKSSLNEIEGVGPASAEALLKEFKSVKRIRELSRDELMTVLDKKKAQAVYDFFHGE
ncbi:MAG: excinuclease ABC subunit C [Sphingobacteriales bacterium]